MDNKNNNNALLDMVNQAIGFQAIIERLKQGEGMNLTDEERKIFNEKMSEEAPANAIAQVNLQIEKLKEVVRENGKH